MFPILAFHELCDCCCSFYIIIMLFLKNHRNSLFNVSMMLSMALTLLFRTYYDTFSVFFFSFIFAFQIVRFFILFLSQSINWNWRIKFNRDPVAQDHKHLTWTPEYIQTVTHWLLIFWIFHVECQYVSCWSPRFFAERLKFVL